MAAVKGLVIFMGFLIVTLMGLIVYGFYQKAQNPNFKFFASDDAQPRITAEAPRPDAVVTPSTAPLIANSFGEVSLDLPSTAQVISASAAGNRLVMVIARDGQNADLVAVVDMNTGKVLGRVKTSP